jgi:acetolactate synthase-1/2/3 large subunit
LLAEEKEAELRSDVKNGAEILVDALAKHGVDTIFGFPGDTSIAFYDVLARRVDVRHVLARDERHAGFMADAYTRTTRRLGVCEASSGAGAVYLASGLAEAFASSVPLLAISTDNNRRSFGTSPISEVDQESLYAACTKWRGVATACEEIPELVARAIGIAVEGRPGPVALIFPEDVLEARASTGAHAETDRNTVSDVARRAPVQAVVPGERLAAPEAASREAASLIEDARSPVIVAGGGAHLSDAGAALRDLVDHAAMPIGTSIHGKGIVDEGHPLALGVVGGNGARDYANEWVRQADLVMFVGTRANATDTLGFTAPPREGTRIVHIDTDPDRAGHNYPGSLPLVGDARTIVSALRSALPAASAERRADRQAALARLRAEWAVQVGGTSQALGQGVLSPREVVSALHEAFDDGPRAWVAADAGTPTPYLACFWESRGDWGRVVIPRGHGPMGYAIPAAIGIAVAHPGDRVLCLTTENSLAMAVAEWETARRLRLPVTFVVLDNTALAWIKMIQHLYAGGRYFAVDPGPIDPVHLAAGMGLPAVRTESIEQFAACAKRAAASDSPTVIHVRVPEHTQLVPPVPVWQNALSGRTTGRPIH